MTANSIFRRNAWLHRAGSAPVWKGRLDVAQTPQWVAKSRFDQVRRQVSIGWAKGGYLTSQSVAPSFARLGSMVGTDEMTPTGSQRGVLFSDHVTYWVKAVAAVYGGVVGAALGCVVGCMPRRTGAGGAAPNTSFAARMSASILAGANRGKNCQLFCLAVCAVLWLGVTILEFALSLYSGSGAHFFSPPFAPSLILLIGYGAARELAPPLMGACRLVLCYLGGAVGAFAGAAIGVGLALRGQKQQHAMPDASRASQGLGALPPELLLRIARFTDLQSALTLGQTSKTMHALHLEQDACARALGLASNVFPAQTSDPYPFAALSATPQGTLAPWQLQRNQLQCLRKLSKLLVEAGGTRTLLAWPNSTLTTPRPAPAPLPLIVAPIDNLFASAVAAGHLFMRHGNNTEGGLLSCLQWNGTLQDLPDVQTHATQLRSFRGGLLGFSPGDAFVQNWSLDAQGKLHEETPLKVGHPVQDIATSGHWLFAQGPSKGASRKLSAFRISSTRDGQAWHRAWQKNEANMGMMAVHGDALFYSQKSQVKEVDGASGDLRCKYIASETIVATRGLPPMLTGVDDALAVTSQFLVRFNNARHYTFMWKRTEAQRDAGLSQPCFLHNPFAQRSFLPLGENLVVFSQQGIKLATETDLGSGQSFGSNVIDIPRLFNGTDAVALLGERLVTISFRTSRVAQLILRPLRP